MAIGNFLKSLLFGDQPIKVSANTSMTPIENISFPDTYKSASVYHTIPERQDSAQSGTEFGNSIINISATQYRDDLVFEQCAQGNMPIWMSNFRQITVQDAQNKLSYFVSPDVLCVGNDTNFLRVSLNGYTAQKICQHFECMLPTKIIAAQIWKAADLRLMPTAMGASFQMITTATLISHNEIIEKQRNNRDFNIITGHKKDIVYAKHLLTDRSRLSIYGWFYPSLPASTTKSISIIDPIAIQGPNPNSTSHSVDYQDYSSSIRLVSKSAILNDNVVDLSADVLNNKQYAYLISDEGAYDSSNIYQRL